jgi:hypothetical protein
MECLPARRREYTTEGVADRQSVLQILSRWGIFSRWSPLASVMSPFPRLVPLNPKRGVISHILDLQGTTTETIPTLNPGRPMAEQESVRPLDPYIGPTIPRFANDSTILQVAPSRHSLAACIRPQFIFPACQEVRVRQQALGVSVYPSRPQPALHYSVDSPAAPPIGAGGTSRLIS